MAAYVERVKGLLLEQSRNFLELDSICFPPIDFRDALVRARKQLTESLEAAREKGNYNAVAAENFWVTFSFLVMQLHFRGSQEFFTHLDETQVWAYLFYRTADIYADIVTHTAGPNSDIATILLDNSVETMAENRHRFHVLVQLLRAQRAQQDAQWKPSVDDCRVVMTQFSEAMLREHASEAARKYAIVAGSVLLAGVAIYLLYRKARAGRLGL